jgi:excisionase family DNA binding protein
VLLKAPAYNPSSTELTLAQAARELAISRFRVSSLVLRGVLTARTVGRQMIINRADLDAFRSAHPEFAEGPTA